MFLNRMAKIYDFTNNRPFSILEDWFAALDDMKHPFRFVGVMVVGCVGFILLLCLIIAQLFSHVYFLYCCLAYRYKVHISINHAYDMPSNMPSNAPIEEHVYEWCKENEIKFIPYFVFCLNNDVLMFKKPNVDKNSDVMAFRTKEDAMAFKLRWL